MCTCIYLCSCIFFSRFEGIWRLKSKAAYRGMSSPKGSSDFGLFQRVIELGIFLEAFITYA